MQTRSVCVTASEAFDHLEQFTFGREHCRVPIVICGGHGVGFLLFATPISGGPVVPAAGLSSEGNHAGGKGVLTLERVPVPLMSRRSPMGPAVIPSRQAFGKLGKPQCQTGT